jgi:hypothetical protein
LAHLAVALDRDPRLAGVVALRARLAFAGVRDSADSRRFGAWFGFELAETTRAATPRQRVRAIIDDLWLLALTYTFNPGALRRRALVRRHDDMWISRAALIARYGAEAKGSG